MELERGEDLCIALAQQVPADRQQVTNEGSNLTEDNGRCQGNVS